jgi:glycine cleavage system H lipoate-binding protein
MTHEFLSIYPAKLMEYGLAILYLLLFIPFWSYVQGRRVPVTVAARAPAPRAELTRRVGAPLAPPRPSPSGWFHVPGDVHLHPGHTWARVEPDGLVSIGVDDFGHKLVGATAVALPAVGSTVGQGEPAIELCDGRKKVALLAPVDGTVAAVNPAAGGTRAIDDPYASGWLVKVRPSRLAANLRQLASGAAARRFLEDAAEALAARVRPELGAVLQDGGTPVDGIAHALAGDAWDELAREFFRT